MIIHEEYKSTYYNSNHNIKRLKTKIKQLQDEIINTSNKVNSNKKFEEIKKKVDEILDEKKLGSTMLISTEQYFSLVLSHPCSHCNNIDIQNKSCCVSYTGFNVTIDMDCQQCGTVDSYSNQSEGINFSHLVAAAALVSGINHYAMQTVLAVTGITAQSCKRSYHHHQSQIFSNIILKAEKSAKQALNAAIAHANTKEKRALTIGFNCS